MLSSFMFQNFGADMFSSFISQSYGTDMFSSFCFLTLGQTCLAVNVSKL